jgi:hemolysin activation/secretion protein
MDEMSSRGTPASWFAAALEVSHTFKVPGPLVSNFSLFAFVDYGAVWNHDVSVAYLDETLGSVGFGVRGRIGGKIDAQVLVAIPWEDKVVLTDTGTRVYFSN